MYKIILNINVKPKLVRLDSSLAILEIRLFLFFLRSLNVLLTSSSWNFTATEQTGLCPQTFTIGDVYFFKKTDSGLNSGSSVNGLTAGGTTSNFYQL